MRAGLGVTVLPAGMVPSSFTVLGRESGLPGLPAAEIALLTAAAVTPPVNRLADHIVKSLEAA